MQVNVSIIIPAYNEAFKISEVLQKIKNILDKSSEQYEIIVVDDGSTDGTGEKARVLGVKVISHAKNLGYGRSLKDAIRQSCGEFIFMIDADGTYDIDKMPEMIKLAKGSDLVVGKRNFTLDESHYFKRFMREYFRNYTKYYAGRNIEDLNSGQRIFRKKDIMDDLDRYPDGFSFTSTMTVFYIIKKKNIFYTPIRYYYVGRESKFRSRFNSLSIIKLTLWLTFIARPLKMSLQFMLAFAAPLILLNIMAPAFSIGLFLGAVYFVLLSIVSLYLLFCFIYINGKRIVR